jgi:peptidyl-prolyl cis-trans isomerase SurA
LRICLTLMILLTLAGPGRAQELADRIVAVIDRHPVFLSDVDAAVAEDLYLMSMRGQEVPTDSMEIVAMRRDALDGIIERRIVIAKARALDIEISRTEVEDALDSWLGDMISASGSEEAFMAELERRGLNLPDFKARYRKEIEEQLLVSRLMRQEFGMVQVTEADVVSFYENKYDSIPETPEELEISHIVMVPEIDAVREAAALEKVEIAVNRLEAGEPFGVVARDVSEDRLTRESGGEIGLVALGDLSDEIAGIAAQLGPGEVSAPVRTRYGFEIVKVDGVEDGRYRLRHILVALRPERSDTLEARQLAEEVRARALSGESFEVLAREYSDDPNTSENGGYIGRIEVESLDQAYLGPLGRLEPGDISEVIEIPQGFQILKLISRSAGRKPGLDEARGWIRELLESRRREQLFQDWVERASEDVYVKRSEL